MKKLIRNDINTISTYIPGKPIQTAQKELGRRQFIKLASNENAYGASPKAKRAIRAALNAIFRYPDGACQNLKKRTAQKLALQPKNLIFGNGSDELIDVIIKTFVNPGEEILTSQTTFIEYVIVAQVNGVRVKTVPLRNFTYDLDALRKKVTKKTKLIFIANPNNPTGTYITKKQVAAFLAKLPSRIVVIFDEAYCEYLDANNFPRLTSLINRKNIIVLRTFSKAYGLAGLRIGYAIAKPEFIAVMNHIKQPFNVNFLAQKAAEAALSDSRFLMKSKRGNSKEKRKLYAALKRIGITYVPSQANFIMMKAPIDGLKFSELMLKKGIIVRDLYQYQLRRYVRVTIGTPAENNLFITALKKLLKERV